MEKILPEGIAIPRRPSEERLGTPEGISLVEKVKNAVFDEFDRALLEGTATRKEVDLQKKHAEAVAELSLHAIEVLDNEGINLSEAQKQTIQIYAYLHDALKIVPEREKVSFPTELLDITTRISQIESRLQSAPPGNDTSKLSGKLARLKAQKDELEEFQAQSTAHSGRSTRTTRLLLHGEDSALWAEQLLTDLGFSSEFIEKAKLDLITHMPMPYVNTALEESKQAISAAYSQAAQVLKRTAQAALKGRTLAVEEGEKEAEYYLEKGSGRLLPNQLDEQGKFIQPQSIEGAILFASDLISPTIMAGKNLTEDRIAGCFDRYLAINLELGYTLGVGFGTVFEAALAGPEPNIHRLKNPPQETTRPLAAKVERILGEKLGDAALKKLHGFVEFIQEGITINDVLVSSLDDLTVWDRKLLEEDDIQAMLPGQTLERYYQAVGAYRKAKKLDPSKILER